MSRGLKITINAADDIPDDLPHKDRYAEIVDLSMYLKPELHNAEASELSLVIASKTAPSIAHSGIPWIRLAGDGSPLGLMHQVRGEYVDALPHAVRAGGASLLDSRIEKGTGVATLHVTANEWQTFKKIAVFTFKYAQPPSVFVSVIGGSLFESKPEDASVFFKVTASKDSFDLSIKTNLETTGVERTVEVSWTCIGELKPSENDERNFLYETVTENVWATKRGRQIVGMNNE